MPEPGTYGSCSVCGLVGFNSRTHPDHHLTKSNHWRRVIPSQPIESLHFFDGTPVLARDRADAGIASR